MPAPKYNKEGENKPGLEAPLVKLASRESEQVRKYYKLVIDLAPKILTSVAVEHQQRETVLFDQKIEMVPIKPIKTRQSMWEVVFTAFLVEKPWLEGFKFRTPPAIGLKAGASGFKQVNVLVEPKLAEKIVAAYTSANVSKASFIWSGLYWGAKYLIPPSSIQANW